MESSIVITEAVIAEIAGCSKSSIANWKKGKTGEKLTKRIDLAHAALINDQVEIIEILKKEKKPITTGRPSRSGKVFEQTGCTVEQILKAADVSRASLYNWIDGKDTPRTGPIIEAAIKSILDKI